MFFARGLTAYRLGAGMRDHARGAPMKHDWLRGKCREGKVSVYEAAMVQRGRFQAGNVLLNDSYFRTKLLARGPDAWPVIEANAADIEATLECAKCREQHVLVRGAENGLWRIATDSTRLGRFIDYEACHYSDWFKFLSKRVSFDRVADFTCQRCGGREVRSSKFI